MNWRNYKNKEKQKLYVHRKIIEFSKNYTDIQLISKQIFDLNTLKYVLLNKKQLAIFNRIEKHFLPFSEYNDKLSKLINYEKNHFEITDKLNEFYNDIARRNRFESNIDRKLAKLYFN